MSGVHYLTIDAERAGQRIDNFLITYLKAPKTFIYRILRKGEVRVNKGRVQPTYRLQAGDEIRVPPVKMDISEVPIKVSPDFAKILSDSVLYEDEGLIIINKPSGMAVHGGSGVHCGVIEALRAIRPEDKHLELVHRLDRETSGCLMIAKKRSVLRALHTMLRDKTVKKVYHALVIGRWPKNMNKVDAALVKHSKVQGECRVYEDEDGKDSVTTFGVVKYFKQLSLVEAHPHTGRTHQIRVHSQFAGHPIVGDEKYAPKAQNTALCQQYGVHRLCLHAIRLSFVHPLTEARIQVTAPYDKALNDIMKRLEADA